MATAKSSSPAETRATEDRVYHPLHRLHGTIRRYILIEGVLSIFLFFIAWFTIALVLDYGLFQAFAWDWVQETGRWFRATGLLVAMGFLAFILIFRIVRRYVREFTYSALALVLERKFPKLLGDRLITAVQLADIPQAEKYGYSAAMIRQTIDEARERVEKVPVNEVFNWRRLRVMATVVVASVAGLLALGFVSHAIAAKKFEPVRAAWKCWHVTTILAERDMFLMKTPWPRQALVELRGDAAKPAGIRVARDGGVPVIQVKAFRWVLADRDHDDGWRPLKWADVTPELVGMPVPSFVKTIGDGESKSTITIGKADPFADEVLENPLLRGSLETAFGADEAQQFERVFARLEEMAAAPSYGRTLRKLDKPRSVSFKYTGINTGSDGALKALTETDYEGEITGLQEDVLVTVRAEDYRTRQFPITRVPPPSFKTLTKIEYQPAYLHHAPPKVPDPNNPDQLLDSGWDTLKTHYQQMPEGNLSLTGDHSPLIVPLGTQVVITGSTEKPIVRAYAKPRIGRLPGAKLGSADPIDLEVVDNFTFRLSFRGEANKITETKDFDIAVVNEDGLITTRRILIQKADDNAPIVEALPEVIRKVGKDYWVTPRARIPFNPETHIDDDQGLSRVVYRAVYKPSDAVFVQAARGGQFMRNAVLHLNGRAFGPLWESLRDYATQVRADDANAEKTAVYGLGKFYDLDRGLRRETLATLQSGFDKPKTGPKLDFVKSFRLETKLVADVERSNGLLTKFQWNVTGDYFDIGLMETTPGKRLEVSPGDIQPRYDMTLYIEATDTNYATGPKITRSEPLPFLIVSSSDLLVEIGKDEEKMALRLEEALKRLAAARGKYEFVRSKVERPLADELDAVSVRSKDAIQDIAKARDIVLEVAKQFRRLERECVVNRMLDATTAHHGRFANRVERALGEGPSPVAPEEDRLLQTGVSPNRPYGDLTPQGTFPATEKRLSEAQDSLDTRRFPDPAIVSSGYNLLVGLESEITLLYKFIGEAGTKDRLRNELKAIRDRQEQIGKAMLAEKIRIEGEQFKETPKLGTVGQLFLSKGETKKVKQTIDWRQFKGDSVTIKLTSSDATNLIVPAEKKLTFDDNSTDFEYEIRAGSKDGEYTITLTPQTGDPVKVSVQVK